MLEMEIFDITVLTFCYVWQSRVEIEGYSVAYFNRIDAFGAPYHRTSVKARAHMRSEDA